MMLEHDQRQNADGGTTPRDGLASTELAHLLAVERQQQTIAALAGGPLTVRALAERLADGEVETTTSDDYKREYVTLHQDHLPKLAEYGVIDYDDDRKGIAPGPRFETAQQALAALQEVAGDD